MLQTLGAAQRWSWILLQMYQSKYSQIYKTEKKRKKTISGDYSDGALAASCLNHLKLEFGGNVHENLSVDMECVNAEQLHPAQINGSTQSSLPAD